MSVNGSMAQADTWISLQGRAGRVRSSSLGIEMRNSGDFVVIELADGDQVHIYGDGQIWMDSKYITIQDEEINWR